MNSRQTNLNQTQSTNKKENITVEIPYVGKQSHIFAKDISKLIWKFSAVHLTPIYKTCKVGNYFNLKSNTPALLLSNVVYRYQKFLNNNQTYKLLRRSSFTIFCWSSFSCVSGQQLNNLKIFNSTTVKKKLKKSSSGSLLFLPEQFFLAIA